MIFITFDGCLYFSVNFPPLELGGGEEETRCGTKEVWDFFVLGSQRKLSKRKLILGYSKKPHETQIPVDN